MMPQFLVFSNELYESLCLEIQTKPDKLYQFTSVLSLPTFWIIQPAKQVIEIQRDILEKTNALSCIQGWFTVQYTGFDDCTARTS